MASEEEAFQEKALLRISTLSGWLKVSASHSLPDYEEAANCSDLVAGLAEVQIGGRTLCACSLCKRSIPIHSTRLKGHWKEWGIALLRVPLHCCWAGIAALLRDSISSIYFVNKSLGFPAYSISPALTTSALLETTVKLILYWISFAT